MASVLKRGGFWYAKWTDATGKRCRKRIEASSKAQAKALADELEVEARRHRNLARRARNGLPPRPEDMTETLAALCTAHRLLEGKEGRPVGGRESRCVHRAAQGRPPHLRDSPRRGSPADARRGPRGMASSIRCGSLDGHAAPRAVRAAEERRRPDARHHHPRALKRAR